MKFALSAVLALLVTGTVMWCLTPPHCQVAHAQPREDLGPPSARHLFHGAGGCASAACHGGSPTDGIKGSEYSTWFASDPHARAYSVLFEPKSVLILKNLRGSTAGSPAKEKLCLDCHATNPDPALRAEQFSVSDGISCESCHGASEHWRTVHYVSGWKQLSDSDKEKRFGILPTKDLTARAKKCAECHVGSGDKDVNHDLIAAGHPPLNFEYAAFLSIYPGKHWSVADERRRYPDFEARAWIVGQAETSRTALKLLEYRAKSTDKAWPEFAEYDCFACHHDLREPSKRPKPSSDRPAGSLPWGTWYFSKVAEQEMPSWTGEKESALPALLQALRKEMQVASPDRNRVAEAADRAAKEFDTIRIPSSTTPEDSLALIHRRFAALAGDDQKLSEGGWDQAAQLYLALAAHYQAEGDLDARYRKTEARTGLEQMKKLLRFPGNSNSPANFDAELFRSHLSQIKKQLGN